MSCNDKNIGGYFELELNEGTEFHKNAIALNLARNCLKYIIRAHNIKNINIPFYTCPVVWKAVRDEGCSIKFYHIDKDFMPVQDFEENDYILYTNYFGVCAKNVKLLAQKYKNLIVDNALAFFMPNVALANFYSPRKFFGVPDGGYLYSKKVLNENFEKDISYQRAKHLLMRLDSLDNEGYQEFLNNETSFEKEPICFMSNLTKKILSSINYEKVKHQRLLNFNYLHEHLKSTNELTLSLQTEDVPMVYPYLIKDSSLRKKLLENKIYLDTFWQPLDKNSIEAEFQKFLLPLPVDQRYNECDMAKILNVLKNKNI